MNPEGLLEKGREFHGHLGPFLALGLRMGSLARERLGDPDPVHSLECLVELENKRPVSCVIDGIQVSSGCTLGKGNIKVRSGRGISATFGSEGKSVKITPRREIMEMLGENPGGKMAERVMEMPIEGLFEVENAES